VGQGESGARCLGVVAEVAEGACAGECGDEAGGRGDAADAVVVGVG